MSTFPATAGRRVETPTVLQMEAEECGAATLGIVLAYYGRHVPLPELRRDCGVSRHGSDAYKLRQAARAHGLEVTALKLDVASLRQQTFPCIIHWAFDHFVVVEGFEKDRVYLNNPECGRMAVGLDEFLLCYTGVALLCRPGPKFEKRSRPTRIGNLLWDPLRQAPAGLLFCIVAGFLLVVPGLAAPVFTQVYVDAVLLEERQDWLRPLLLCMAVVAVVQTSLRFLQARAQRWLQLRLALAMSSRFMWHVLRLPVDYFAHRFAGEVSARVHLNDQVAGFAVGPLAGVLLQVVLLVFYAAVMLCYSVLLTGVAVAAAVVEVYILWRVTHRLLDYQMRVMQEGGRLDGVAVAGLQCIETLKASGQEGGFFTRWVGGYARALIAGQELSMSQLKLGLWPVLFSSLTNTLVLVVGGLEVMDGRLTIGMLVAFQGLMGSFQSPLEHLLDLGFHIQEMQVNLARLRDVRDNPIDPQTERPETNGAAPVVRGELELRDVTFGYHPLDAPLIEDLSLTLLPGQRVALVGATGSGKSTVAKLVAGLYEPWSGEILFDGRPRAEWPRAVLANTLGYVEQDFNFFMGSVEDNLTLWDRSVPDARLERACQDAAVHDVLRALPGGYRAELQEAAANLSGGQRQRLEIARALVNQPAVLILDEATNSLDSETEYRIYRQLWQRGVSLLIVAHRLSAIRDCDEIIVLRQGKVAERGTHAALMERNGEYARLIRSDEEDVAA